MTIQTHRSISDRKTAIVCDLHTLLGTLLSYFYVQIRFMFSGWFCSLDSLKQLTAVELIQLLPDDNKQQNRLHSARS